jgi:hypothetical protein
MVKRGVLFAGMGDREGLMMVTSNAGMGKVRRFTLVAMVAFAAVAVSWAVTARSARADFGIASADQQILSSPTGGTFTQAGGHPYEIDTEVYYNTHPAELQGQETQMPDADTKDLTGELPPGLLGNPAGLPQCTAAQLVGIPVGSGFFTIPTCPIGSEVGTILVKSDLTHVYFGGFTTWEYPVYNMVPPPNAPAAFGFNALDTPITFTANVRNGGDFGVNVVSTNIPIGIGVDGFTLKFWGNPGDPRHDAQRCDFSALGFLPGPTGEGECQAESPVEIARPHSYPLAPKAFLTLPVSCTPPGTGLVTNFRADSWDDFGVFYERAIQTHLPPSFPAPPNEWGPPVGVTGCGVVPFNPSVIVEPTNHEADTPTGLNIDFKLPQDGLSSPEGIATADVKKTVFALPAGMSVSPSAANGLGACSLPEIGLNTGNDPACPDSSKIGSVTIDTPLLEEPLNGSIYLAKQSENPFGSLLAIYIVAQARGVTIKLAGRIDLDPVTGQLVTTVENSPQLPFDDLKLDFKGGPRSPLVNPHTCGTYTATGQMTPWSGAPPANIGGSFQITSGPAGAPCPQPQQFSPGFNIGTTNNQAGAFSPLSLTMTRGDGDQQLGGVSMKLPTGLLGTLSAVKLCYEPQAAQGTCGPESQIGTLTVAAGAGPNPFYVTGGKIFATGPYKGAPYGLSVVVPAKAGPIDLGTVVVRGTIAVDRHTAALTVNTDPLPTILQGIPLDLRVINVNIDRPNFIFNPTDCNPLSITGTLTGGQGLLEPVGSPFQVTNCAILGFKPAFKVTTNGKTSRANGASLDAKLSYPKSAFGHQANIAKVKVELPRQLPSRLQTLQKACPAETFDANPASCPAASKIGTATANTPVLPVILSGPVYFVSHGGEAFPDLVVVLQGYGITVDLTGTTFISKAGITSSTFNQIPDVPINTFELKLPQGHYSALAANGNLCTTTLHMPTLFIAQDGATIKQSTPITATGCAKHKPHRAHAKKHRHGKSKK